jgi:hypothetical protein
MKIRHLIATALLLEVLFAGVTGKVAGRVTSAETGEPLIGVNVQVVGTYLGAATDAQGYYAILNIPPGVYSIKATIIGYTPVTIERVRVEIDLTTPLDIEMTPAVIKGEQVEVFAERKVIKLDVAASQHSISSEDISELPVSSIAEVIGLQAGISGFSIRGGGTDETLYMVDGIVMNDERSGTPNTGIPLSAVQDISVQTGGFTAEYHNVRSGVVNVVTKEGSPSSYGGTISIRVSPSAQKHFGISPYDRNSYWFKPYFDEDVMWTGTNNGAWDEYTQRQYPTFEGWNRISEMTLADDDPTNDLTPSGALKLFTWEHRKNGAIADPDYTIDAGFGGPVPLISQYLGNLRFYASLRQEENMYLFAVSRPGLTHNTSLIKVTSDLSPSMKLSLTYLGGTIKATTLSRGGGTAYMDDIWDLASQVNSRGFTMPWRLFTNDYWSPTTIRNATYSAKLTHQLSQKTFYEFLVKKDSKTYHTWHGARRDTTRKYEVFEGWFADEAPYGFQGTPEFSVEGRLAFGGAVSTSRDTSDIQTYTVRLDLTSQFNPTNQFKTGFEFIYNDLNLEFGSRNEFLPEGNYWTSVKQNPYRLSVYGQDKLEYEGFIATVGLNLDYINPNGEWYVVDVFDDAFFSSSYSPEKESEFPTKKIKPQLTLSPRLAISHPITENSKLYFNYGHYRQIPIAQDLYRIRRGNANEVINMGDPNLPMAKTISYELGYDHALADMYLIHLAAYYKDISDQQDYTQYISANSKVIYYQLTANSYEDIRGFEVELTKRVGRWISGNINYEYRVNTSGYFGVGKYYENPSEQRKYLNKNRYQSKPRPVPRVKSTIDFHTPSKFGPRLKKQYPLGDWHLNLVSTWRKGSWFTYNPNRIPGILYNVRWKDRYTFDVKISKTFVVGKAKVKFYADIYNVFNLKTFASGYPYGSSTYGFTDSYDWNYYMQSLHLPAKIGDELGYHNFPGNDQPGDYRNNGVEFVPMEWVSDVNTLTSPSERPIYYDAATDRYLQYSADTGWHPVDPDFYDWVIENKAYIDMPNQSFFTFLAPRDIFIGLNISYDF